MTTADAPAGAPELDPAFPIAWDPADRELEWEWDDMHTPRALPPLCQDYVAQLAGGFVYMYRHIGSPKALLLRIWNGYVYFGLRIDAPSEEHAAIRAAEDARCRAEIPLTAAYWRASLDELRAGYAEIDAIRGDEPGPELVGAWDRAWDLVARAWEIHFHAILGPYQVLDDLADRYEQIVPGGSPADALELVAGLEPEMRGVERDLNALADVAAAAPAVVARLRDGPPPTVAELIELDGGDVVAAALDRFLASHGHLGQVTDDLMEASWSADPRPLLGDLGKRIGRETTSIADRAAGRAALAAEREAVVRAALADRPDELAEFDALLASAREIGHLTEGHNYWIDRMANDRLRRLTRRVGRRLVADGVIDAADDIDYLHRDEVAESVRGPADRRPLVHERRAIHDSQRTLRPPRKVGRVAPPDPDAKPNRFDGAHVAGDGGVVRGTGASAGVARGTARVVLGPQDFDRVQPGDIVVATTSNPGWVPLFAIAGGFVTDTGGVLSHAAVVAREFGVPAVVGTREGTVRIADGATIEIDGSTGVVRLA